MFFKKHPNATAIVLALGVGMLQLSVRSLAVAFALLIGIYLIVTDPGALALYLIAGGALLFAFVAFLSPLLPKLFRHSR